MSIILLGLSSQTAIAQQLFEPMPEDDKSIIFPFNFEYNNHLIAQTGVRYGLLAANSPYVLDQMMVLWDVYEKVPAAVRLVPDGDNLPIWNFRYWPDEEIFTWVEIRDYSIKPVIGYVCNRKFEVIDTFGVSNPHEFYIMPNNLGYAFISTQHSGNIAYPTIMWMSPNHDTNLYWSSANPTWGINATAHSQSTCSYTTLDTFDNNIIDYYHPNSISAIQIAPDTVVLGVYSRNTDTEFEITASFDGNRWQESNVRVISKNNHLGHQSDDSVWVNTAHDLQYLYANEDTIVKSLWDNGGCRAKPNTGYKVFTQHAGDSVKTIRKGLYNVLGQSTAMGNGGVMLQNRYASSVSEINEALSYGNIGSANYDLSNDNGVPKIGVWDKNDHMVYAIDQDYSFLTYRFYPYFDNQLQFDDLRPHLAISFSPDSSTVTLSIDSTQYTDIMWSDSVFDVFSRTLTAHEFVSKEIIAFVTNNPNWFWFSSHRYYTGSNVVGIKDMEQKRNTFTVYPNPIKPGNTLNLSAKVNATLTDLAGKSITKCTDCDAMLIPDATAPGVYLLNVVSGQSVSTSKVVVY